MDILNLAKSFLPANSPILQKIELAQTLAANFPKNRNGLQAVLQQYNISQQQFQNALKMLENPMIGGILNRFQPGLTQNLQKLGGEMFSDTAAFSPSASTLPPSVPPASSSLPADGGLDSLRQRLNKMR